MFMIFENIITKNKYIYTKFNFIFTENINKTFYIGILTVLIC